MRPMARHRALRFIKCGILLLACAFFSCGYLVKQGYYVAKYNLAARDIKRLLNDQATGKAEKEFLERVLDIRTFAVEKIGLARNGNYSCYVKIDKKYLVDVVSASAADTFRQYTWCFPFFGCVPYKGYFDRKDALSEAQRLKREGYDVMIGVVDAFSSLGFFKDPVYSFMSRLSLYGLASLIIHEQTHATVFLKNHIDFNEELATFVGDEGAMSYIRSRYGDTSAACRDALLEKQDGETWHQQLRDLYRKLSSIYASPASREEKLRLKRETIAGFKQRLTLNYDDLFKTNRFKRIQNADINNAYLAICMTYTKDLSLLYELYKKNGNDLSATVGQLKPLKKMKGKNPKEYIRTVLLSKQPDT